MYAIAIESFQDLSARWLWPTLLHSVWISLFAVSIAALIIQAATRLSHQARHAILLAAFALAIAGPALATVLQQAIAGQTPAETPLKWEITSRSRRGEQGVTPPATTRSSIPLAGVSPPQSRTLRLLTSWLSSAASVAQRVRPFVVTAWLFGVAIIAAFLAVGARSIHRLCREAATASQSVDDKARAMASQLGLSLSPKVLVHPRIEEPFLCGIVRPAILLPARWIASCRTDSLDAILAHELAHARRLDHLVNLAQRLGEMLLFFHPAIHWLSRSLRRQREFCADALAVRLTSDPLALAGALESVALLRLSSRRAPAGGSSLGGQSTSLLPRIEELLGMKPSPTRPPFWPFLALPAATLFALVAASAGAASDRPPSSAQRPAAVDRPSTRGADKLMISYEVRWISSLDAQPWRDLCKDRLKPVSQEADVSVWIADDKAIYDLLTLAQAQTTVHVLQAPKALAEPNATATIANVAKQYYVADMEKVENGDSAAFRPIVNNIDIGVRMGLTGTVLDRRTKLTLNLHDADLLAMHTLRRNEQIGDKPFATQYQIPTLVERHCQAACEVPDGSSLVISLGLSERRGRSSNAAETASELLQLVGLPPVPARSVTCERLVTITPRRIVLPTYRRASQKATPAVKPESASQPSHARQ